MIWPVGKLTFDKSNQLFSYFMKSIEIVHDHHGEVRRIWDFDDEMAVFCGNSSSRKADGTENRAWYNKSIFPRYYGFLDLKHTTNDATGDVLLSTPRGERLLALAEYCPDLVHDPKNEHSFRIPVAKRQDAYRLFMEAFQFGTFGRQNSGAESSDSDIDPPKVMMRVINELGSATKEEICYCIFALYRQDKNSIEDAISQVQSNRHLPGYSYEKVLKNWGLENISGDFKLARLLADAGLSLLRVRKDHVTHREYYYFDPDVQNEIIKAMATSSCKYRPMRWLIDVGSNVSSFLEWVRGVVAGGEHDDSTIFIADLTHQSFVYICDNAFRQALTMAFKKPNRNIYFVIVANNENQLRRELDNHEQLLDRSDDIRLDYHGWSKTAIQDVSNYYVLMQEATKYRGPDGKKISQILPFGKIKLPANFHFIGGVRHVQ